MEELEAKLCIHQQWLTQHPHYNPCKFKDSKYSDVVNELYLGYKRVLSSGNTKMALGLADYLLRHDIREYKKIDKVSLHLQELEKKLVAEVDSSDESLWAFITVGFNEQTITPKKMADVSDRISKLKYFKSCYYVLERHRENGIHHHTHFLVQFFKKEYKSKLIDWIYQTKGLKEVCLGKNFIDIKGPLNGKHHYQTYDLYLQYINGNKKEDKLKYVELDRKWRLDNNLERS